MNITKNLANLGNRIGEFYVANKPHIFTGIGIGGTIVTAILSAESGARSARKIDSRERELGRRMTLAEKTKLCWTDAIAPAVVCAATCYCDFKANRIFTTELAKKTTMLIASEKAYEKLSQKTKEVLGEKKAKQVQDEIVKDKVHEAVQTGQLTIDSFDHAPRVGNGQLSMFVDEYTMLPFWSNIDYVALQVAALREMMSDLAARDPDKDYEGKIVGVYYKEWLHRIGYTDPKICSTPERKYAGWNKGFDAKYHTDDDDIDYTTTAIEWSPGVAVTAVGFTTPPTDMRMGRMIKSSGLVT